MPSPALERPNPEAARAAPLDLLPAIDLRGGKVIRLLQGDDRRRTEYDAAPEAQLEAYAEAGVSRVHVVDLDAALGEEPQRPLLEALARRAGELGVRLQLGGGLRGGDAVAWALGAGCDRVVLGSLVSREPETFAALAAEHPDRLVPALDAAGAPGRETVRTAGWTTEAADSLDTFCRRLRGLPCPAVLVTDIDRDGTLEGPNLELARRVGEATGIPALLSGGVQGLEDLAAARQAPRSAGGSADGIGGAIGGVIVGKALYEGRFTVAQALAVCAGVSPEDAMGRGPEGEEESP